MARAIRKIETHLNRLGIWWVILGPGGVFTTAYAVITSFFHPIVQYGWSAIALASIAMALFTITIFSLFLIAIRLFRPLTSTSMPKTPSESGDEHMSPEAVNEELDSLQKHISELVQKTEVVREQCAGMKTELDTLQITNEQIVSIAHMTNNVLLPILRWMENRSTANLWSTLVDRYPQHPDTDEHYIIEKMSPPNEQTLFVETIQTLRRWQSLVEQEAMKTPISEDIQKTILGLRQHAERNFREIPQDKRPPYIDPVDFKDFYIEAHTCETLANYIRGKIGHLNNAENALITDVLRALATAGQIDQRLQSPSLRPSRAAAPALPSPQGTEQEKRP